MEPLEPHSLTTAFGIWAGVVGMIGVAIVWELSRLRREVRVINDQLARHMINTEHRVTAIESHLTAKSEFVPRNHFGVGQQ